MTTHRFPFAFAGPQGVLVRGFGVVPATAHVDVDEREVRIRFGMWSTRFPRSAVTAATRTGPYRWWKVIGPPRVSFLDQGLTLATNRDDGVCILVNHEIPGALPLGVRIHEGVTVTVADPEGLVEALAFTGGPLAGEARGRGFITRRAG